jgi:hypothetical protein
MAKVIGIVAGVVFIAVCQLGIGGTWYVDDSVAASGDGTSWETAFKKIQEGIDAASNGDTVIVAEGTYLENVHFDGKNIVLTSTDPLNPTVVANTIIDGNKAGSVIAFESTEDESCVLRGFTVRNGSAENGGGICGGSWDRHTRATIRNNTIAGSSAGRGGGLGYCDGLIKDNAIAGNSADYGGGLYECGGTIENNSIANNTANSNSQPFGGGLNGCSGLIQNNTIAGNAGAGLANCAGTIQNNKIARNTGGGVYGCGGLIQNNLVTENSWDWGGGGLCECSGTIQNNTIAGNLGDGVAFCKGTIRNCILWGNSREELIESKRITFSCIEGLTEPGADNINRDPLFVDSANGDYRLRAGSPCVDSGLGYYWFAWPQRDLNGNCRLAGKRVDIGCYEFGAFADSDGDLLSDTDESKQGTDFLKEDTDDDGLRDGLELLRGSDPLAPTPPRIVHVPTGASKTQQWLCLAVDGDEIIVATGTYRENLQFCGANVVLRCLQPDDPGIVAATILDGGEVGSVVSFLGTESEACVLAGFTIQNGRAISGAGILGGTPTAHSRATLQHNIVADNKADTLGSGLAYCDGLVQNNTITGNSNNQGGSGGGCYDCDGAIRNNKISDNNAWLGGGLSGCDGPIEANAISDNRSQQKGGGLSRCDGRVRNNVISGNVARDGDGGGLYWCGGTIENNIIFGNSAYGYGGGLTLCGGTIRNNLISGNSVVGDPSSGAGLERCGGTILNNTIYANSSKGWGGGLAHCDGTIRNCIIWGNRADNGEQLDWCAIPSYCCISAWTQGGQGNISPKAVLLADPDGPDNDPRTFEDNNCRLLPDSPCIDSGDNSVLDPPGLDLDRNLRIAFGGKSVTVDMGAYEYNSVALAVTQIASNGPGELQLVWNSQPNDAYTIWSCVDLLAPEWLEEATIPSGGESTLWTDSNVTSPRKFYLIELR